MSPCQGPAGQASRCAMLEMFSKYNEQCSARAHLPVEWVLVTCALI